MKESSVLPKKGERIAKVIARSGFCSRRDAEKLINEKKVFLNGILIEKPATLVTSADKIAIDGQVLDAQEPTRLWLYYKPIGLVTTHKDPQNRPTVFDQLKKRFGYLISVGRLDLNSEGLLLLTNDGEFSRKMEYHSNLERVYKVRILGNITDDNIQKAATGLVIDGIKYNSIKIERVFGKTKMPANSWLKITLSEGKNREIRKVLNYFGLYVNRLIRIQFGPYKLFSDMKPGDIKEVLV